jgi:molybdopterin-guanine dinucleotide biosynthesis protein A
VLISANRNADAYRRWAPVVGDDPANPAYSGPLAGIAAGLAAAPTPWVAVVPCDLPLVPADAVARLAAAVPDAGAAYAAPGGSAHSLVCLLHRDLGASLAQALASGERRVARWYERVGAQAVPFEDAAAFANLNSPGDLAAAAPGARQ